VPERVAVVTGASSGIGLYTAIGLARAGMRVVMTGRDRARTEGARRLVTERSGSDRVDIAFAEFSRLAEVRRLAEAILASFDRLDVLVNNAGLFSPYYRMSADGFELTFAVNHLAPFLLTNLLIERLKVSTPARIVTVASEAHRGNRVDIGAITRPPDWTMMRAYGRSKLCNILFTRELASRLDASEVVATCLHPGMVATGIAERGGLVEIGWRLAKPFMLSPEKGAETSVFLATVPNPKPFHGGYVIRKVLTQPDPAALDDHLARRLWDESMRLAGLAETISCAPS
jgi:NAD(P)-dependent dehydrogenase (short-subunit alcohol dehydrogenase family)